MNPLDPDLWPKPVSTEEVLRSAFPKTLIWHSKRIARAAVELLFWWVPKESKDD